MNYEIKGTPFPVVICKVADGERMITEKGAMVWMSPNMEMQTSGGGLGKMFSKAFSGESMFQNIYTAHGEGMITFGSCFPGRIVPLEIAPGRDSSKERVPRGDRGRRTFHPLQQKARRRLLRR